jgi:hypothetical protein
MKVPRAAAAEKPIQSEIRRMYAWNDR